MTKTEKFYLIATILGCMLATIATTIRPWTPWPMYVTTFVASFCAGLFVVTKGKTL